MPLPPEIPITIINDMERSLRLLKEPSRLLVSVALDQWLRERLAQQFRLTMDDPPPTKDGDVLFKGIPVVVCEQLEGCEYAFVKGN